MLVVGFLLAGLADTPNLSMCCRPESKNEVLEGDSREFLSREKNSFSRSSDARRRSLRFKVLPNTPDGTSVVSRAITKTGTGVAVLAVLGLYTSVLISSKSFGALELASRASRQEAGEFVAACDTVAVGEMESFERESVIASRDIAEECVWRRRGEGRARLRGVE